MTNQTETTNYVQRELPAYNQVANPGHAAKTCGASMSSASMKTVAFFIVIAALGACDDYRAYHHDTKRQLTLVKDCIEAHTPDRATSIPSAVISNCDDWADAESRIYEARIEGKRQ